MNFSLFQFPLAFLDFLNGVILIKILNKGSIVFKSCEQILWRSVIDFKGNPYSFTMSSSLEVFPKERQEIALNHLIEFSSKVHSSIRKLLNNCLELSR